MRLGLKLKRIHPVLEFDQWQWLKQYFEYKSQKRIEPEKNNGKDGKPMYKLMNNAICKKTMENLGRNNQRKKLFKM